MTFWQDDKNKKPGRWGSDKGFVAAKWDWFYRDLRFAFPVWEGIGEIRAVAGTESSGLEGVKTGIGLWRANKVGLGMDLTANTRISLIGAFPDVAQHFSVTLVYLPSAFASGNFPKWAWGVWVTDESPMLQITTPGTNFNFSMLGVSSISVTHPLVIGKRAVVTVTWDSDSTSAILYAEGLNLGTNTMAFTPQGGDTNGHIGRNMLTDNGTLEGDLLAFYMHDRVSSFPEHRQLYEDPFGPFRMVDENEAIAGSDILITPPTDSLIPIIKRRRR